MNHGDRISRTAKLFADDGSAGSLDEATEIHRSYVLQLVSGRGLGASLTRQVMLATAVNTGVRAFAGGVRVHVEEDAELALPWLRGKRVSEAVAALGATTVPELDDTYPTIVVGDTDIALCGSCVLHATWDGWAGGVVLDAAARLPEEQDCAPAGVLAAGFAVSEAFQHRYGHPPAGRRAVGLSLWRPDLSWRDKLAAGPALRYLPKSYWLAGLGHLGQAYAWAIGCLPYRDSSEVEQMLQDFDTVVESNASTGALSTHDDIGKRKTRVVGQQLESLGFKTSITERRYDAYTVRTGNEPVTLLAGFDRPEPRRELDAVEHGFALAVDAGLGGGVEHYVDIVVHSFPASASARDAFPATPPAAASTERPRAYDAYARTLVADGAEEGEAECGAIDVAGRTVAVAFVGAVASAILLAEPLRMLHGGRRYEVVDLSLRSPEHVEAIPVESAVLPLPFVRV